MSFQISWKWQGELSYERILCFPRSWEGTQILSKFDIGSLRAILKTIINFRRHFGYSLVFRVLICPTVSNGCRPWGTTFRSSKSPFEGESGQNSESPCQLSRNTECYLLDSIMEEKTVRHFSVQKYVFPQNTFLVTAFIHYRIIKDSLYWNLKLKWVWAKKTQHTFTASFI